jgi:curli production assembly/transport component CsgF
LFKQQFGNDGIKIGSYTFGSLSVEVYPSSGGLTVDILDTKTGEQNTSNLQINNMRLYNFFY